MKRYTLYLKQEQLDALAKRSAETHIVVAELIRMAIDAALKPKR
jgi:ribbon-helix-helix protein